MRSVRAYVRQMIPLLRIGFCLLMALVVLDVAMNIATACYPNWLPYRLAGVGFSRDIEQRVDAATKQYQLGAVDPRSHLCALVGLSSLREAVDLALLTEIDGLDCHYLGLCTAGGEIKSIKTDAQAMINSPLKPDLVVVGLNEFLLADLTHALAKQENTDPAQSTSRGWILNLAGFLKSGDWRGAARIVARSVWFRQRRGDVRSAFEDALSAINRNLIRKLGGSKDLRRDPKQDPWREMIRLELAEHVDDWNRNQQMESYRRLGRFAEETYQDPSVDNQLNPLKTLIRDFQQKGAEVVIVLMPEISQLRKNIPDAAVTCLRTTLDQEFGTDGVRLIDFRDALDDELFADITHVNTGGRESFTRILSKVVQEQFDSP
jgi:hypothetical protein